MKTKMDALAICLRRFGPTARVEAKEWWLPSIREYVPMTYCWVGEAIRAVGRDWDDLVAGL